MHKSIDFLVLYVFSFLFILGNYLVPEISMEMISMNNSTRMHPIYQILNIRKKQDIVGWYIDIHVDFGHDSEGH